MPLNAYLPLEAVYLFHETAENWILRRYDPEVQEGEGAEHVRPAWSESIISVFPDRSTRRMDQQPRGQTGPQTHTIYTRTPIRVTDTSVPQPNDVLFDPQGRAWQAIESGEWNEARGFAIVLQRAGMRGQRPWL